MHKLRKLNTSIKCTNWSDIACTELVWKGDASTDLPHDKKFEVSVVISYCDEDMSLFNNYINDKSENVIVRSMTIIQRCPPQKDLPNNATKIQSHWEYPEMNFIQWLAMQFKKSTASQLILPEYYLQDNHFILFLHSSSIMQRQQQGTIRKLEEVIQSTVEDGFGCIQRPPSQMLSYYHDTKVLRTFENSDITSKKPRYYDNFGEWLDQLNLTSIMDGQDLIPVCYGSSFAIQSRDLFLKSNLYFPIIKAMGNSFKWHEHLNAMGTSFKRQDIAEIVTFIERTWAAIFSHHLKIEKNGILRKYTSSTLNESPYTGSFVHRLEDQNLFRNIFTGDTLEKQNIDRSYVLLSLVISHCNEDMSWLKEYIEGIPIQNVTIYSKCESTINGYFPPGSTIVRLPSVGRYDHSYAHHMAQMEEHDATDPDHFILFIRADRYIYREGLSYKTLPATIRIAIQHGFACESKATDKSIYHDSALLKTFKIKSYRGINIASDYINMGQWLDVLGIELSPRIVPVCYGGNFVVKASEIYSRRDVWKRIETSLMRGENIEESYFAERAWAGLLSYPLSTFEIDKIQSIPSKLGDRDAAEYMLDKLRRHYFHSGDFEMDLSRFPVHLSNYLLV